MAVPQSIRNASEPWTTEELGRLKKLAAENLPPTVISLRLGRPEVAIEVKASEAGITLCPDYRPPYGTS
jgi:hypothetical protein